MNRIVFGNSVQGASHKRIDKECQDSKKYLTCEDGTIIMAIADGHGSESCPFSKTGSSIAVNVFVKVLKNLYDGYQATPELLQTFLNREGDTRIAQSIDAEWKRRVIKAHSDNKRSVPKDENDETIKNEVYKMYGSTLVGVMITSSFIFAFQLGDGDISYVDSEGYHQVLESDKILGTETHSLSKIDSWKNAITLVHHWNNDSNIPSLFMLTTDGFSNSYKNEEEFQKTCIDYFEMINQYGYKTIDSNLKDWLNETSEMGCGDDITVLMAYAYDDSVSESVAKQNNEDCEGIIDE